MNQGSVKESATHPRVEPRDGGRMLVASDYLALFQARGLETFDQVMALSGGKVARDFPGRQTVRLELAPAQGIYLKRYQQHYLSLVGRLWRWLGWPSRQDEALSEWQTLHALRALDLPAAIPIAVGQKKQGGLVTQSFLMTAEIVGGLEAGPYVRQLSGGERRRFLLQVAGLVRRFHSAGWVHKDLYISHLLVTPPVTPQTATKLFLIDLQRAIMPCCLRERWVVKDLGALVYSALKNGASARDLFCGYLEYLSKSSLEEKDRRLGRKILARVRWLKTKTPKHDKNFQQLA